MNVAIHQPNLFPRIKTLQKLALADVWIVLDDVQYCQREYQNRSYIVPLKGDGYWCTLPVNLPNGRATQIKDVQFSGDNSLKIISDLFKYSYRGDTLNKRISHDIMKYMEKYKNDFVDFVISSAVSLLNLAGHSSKIIRSSTLCDFTSGKSEKLIALCKKIQADTYISDSGRANYIDEFMFKQNGINILWHIWEQPIGITVDAIGSSIRNGTGLNLSIRSLNEFIDIISQCKISKNKKYAEGK